jgi:hypothetical protein
MNTAPAHDSSLLKWANNAAMASGRAEGSGRSSFNMATGLFSKSIASVPRQRGMLPKMDDLKTIGYLEKAGYIQVHQDPAALAALQSYRDGAIGFYVGLGLMKCWTSGPQILVIRDILAHFPQSPQNLRGFDAAISFWTGRVGSGVKTPIKNVFGIDEGDVKKADDVAQKLSDGDYGGAAEDAGGDIAKGAAIGASIAAATAAGGSIAVAATATGAAIGTAIPIPVVGTAAGAAIGAAVAGAIILGNAIFGKHPAFGEDDYTRMKNRAVESGAIEQVGGVPPDLYGACKYKDGSVSGGDWPFPGTWNHEIRDEAAYRRNWTQFCESLGASAYFPGPGQRGQCVFPDGYSTDGGEFWKPIWPADKKTEWEADQAKRKIQLDNLGSYINGLKEIDKMIAQADAAMRKSGATPSQRDTWMKQIGDAFAKIYVATGQDKHAPLNVPKFIAEIDHRVYLPKIVPALLPIVAITDEKRLMGARQRAAQKRMTMIGQLKVNEKLPIGAERQFLSPEDRALLDKYIPLDKVDTNPVPATPPAEYAATMITQGAVAAAPDHRVALTQPLVANPATKPGVVQAVNNVNYAKKTLMRRVLEFFHVLPKT